MRSIRSGGNRRGTTVIAAAAVIGLLGGGVGFAAATIGSAQIVDNSVKSKDIKDNTVKLKDINKRAQTKLKGQSGPPGPAGSAQAPVTALSGDWAVTKDDCGAGGGADNGNVAIAGGSLQFDSFNDGNARARVDYTPLVGKTLADLASFEYSAKYTQTGTDIHQGVPYFIVKLADGPDVDTDVDSVIFTPGTQAAPVTPSTSGVWQHYSVTTGSGRFNDDAGSAPDVSWESIVRDHGTQVIQRAGIQAGCGGAGTQDTVSLVDNVSLDIAGEKTEFDFGG